MSSTDATIRIYFEPFNPGQFFACCGLLELADRLWPGAEAWFEESHFHLTCDGSLEELLSTLADCEPVELLTLDNGLEVKPLIAPLRMALRGEAANTLTLDAWTTIRVEKGVAVVLANSPWNFWSGQQTSLRIWLALRAELRNQLPKLKGVDLQNLFVQRVLLSGRFGFDPGAAWNALDVGFSPNEQKLRVASSAALELLAAIGIQRFRPGISTNRQLFEYWTWGSPLPPEVAAAAMCGAITSSATARYQGCIVSRGQYAALGFSYPIL